MNERIKKLAKQADVAFLFDPKAIVMTPKMEKFVELIVNDCLTVLNRRITGGWDSEDMEVRRCINDVKDHFGVE